MTLLIDQHPRLAPLIIGTVDGRPVEALGSGSGVKVRARCRGCGVVRELRVVDLVRRPTCRACAPRKGRSDAAPSGSGRMTLLEWAIDRAIRVGDAPLSPCVECERDGGPGARVPVPAAVSGPASVADLLAGTPAAPTVGWAVLDRPCVHRPASWGATLASELVYPGDASVPAASTRPLDWHCRLCGHGWTAAPADRTVRGRACPRCTEAGRRFTLAIRAGARRLPIPGSVLAELVGIVRDGAGEPVDAERAPHVEAARTMVPVVLDPGTLVDGWRVDEAPVTIRAVAEGTDARLAMWRCSTCGHEWVESISDRTDPDPVAGTGVCPVETWTRKEEAAKGGVDRSGALLDDEGHAVVNRHAADLNRALWAVAASGGGIDVGYAATPEEAAEAGAGRTPRYLARIAGLPTAPVGTPKALPPYPLLADTMYATDVVHRAGKPIRDRLAEVRSHFAFSPLQRDLRGEAPQGPRIPATWAPYLAPAARAVAARAAGRAVAARAAGRAVAGLTPAEIRGTQPVRRPVRTRPHPGTEPW